MKLATVLEAIKERLIIIAVFEHIVNVISEATKEW